MIENFNTKYQKINDYTGFIEELFENLGYEYPQDYKCCGKYYIAYNPLISDTKSMSCMIYKKDGIMIMYNGNIEVVRHENRIFSNSITPNEYSRILNKFDIYIDFVMSTNNISYSILREYKELLTEFILNNKLPEWNKRIGFDKVRKFLFYNYINDTDILNYRNINRNLKYISNSFKKPPKEIFKNDIKLIKPLTLNNHIIENYIKSRKIEIINNKVYPIVVGINNYYENGVCICYNNGFKKIRLTRENCPIRYLTYTIDGTYDELFEAKIQNKTNKCFLVEGEFEGLSISNFVDDDVYCLHNTNSLPKNLTQLDKYDTIIVKIDYSEDKYFKIANSLFTKLKNIYPNKKIIISSKYNSTDKKIDYNYMYVKNELTSVQINDIIYGVGDK